MAEGCHSYSLAGRKRPSEASVAAERLLVASSDARTGNCSDWWNCCSVDAEWLVDRSGWLVAVGGMKYPRMF